jgi:hypothetical protein
VLDRIVDQTDVVDLKHIRQQGCIGRLEEAALVTRAHGIGRAVVESQADARRIMAGAILEAVRVRRVRPQRKCPSLCQGVVPRAEPLIVAKSG